MNGRRGVVLGLVLSGSYVACFGDDPLVGPLAADDAGTNPSMDAATDATVVPPSGPVVVNELYQAGTRLQPRHVTLADGSKQFIAWYDTELGVECTFMVQSGGTFACVPKTETSRTGPGLFSKYTCELPLAHQIEGECSRVPPYVSSQLSAACFDDVFKSGPTAAQISYVAETSCGLYSAAGLIFERGDAVPASSLVQAHVVDWAAAPARPAGQPMRAQFLEADDGSSGFFRWVLDTQDAECIFSTTALDPAFRCYPPTPDRANAYDDYFVDSTCETRIVYESRGSHYGCTGERAHVAQVTTTTADVCHTVTGLSFYEMGTTIDPQNAQVYQRASSGTCQLENFALGVGAARVGAALPVEAFGAATAEPPAAAGPPQPLLLDLPDGTRIRRGTYDPAHAAECTFVRAADGKLRCLPRSFTTQVENAYSDAACTVPLLVGHRYGTGFDACLKGEPSPDCDAASACPVPPKDQFVRTGTGAACSYDQRLRVFAVGEPLASHWQQTGAGCTLMTGGKGDAFDTLTEVDPGEFTEGTLDIP